MKSVFITGGTAGIGLELALRYLEKGWRVAVCGREPEKFNHHFSHLMQSQKDHLHFYKVDVSIRDEVKKSILDFAQLGGLHLLIANAGISHKHKTKIPDFEASYHMVHVNLLGVMYSIEAATEVMIPQGGGQIAAISSLAGLSGLPGVSAYSATKSAVQKYLESLHLDLAQFNVHVTSILPGFIETPLTSRNQHKMPFLMKASKAAELIDKAIEKKKMTYSFPFLFSRIVWLLGVIPRKWYKFLMKFKLFNYSRG